MIKAIVFDADGVLLSSKMFGEDLEREFGISDKQLQPFFKERFGKCLIGEADLKLEIKPYLKEIGWTKTTQDFLDFWFVSEDERNHELIDIVAQLRSNGIKCFVATNQEKYRSDYMRQCMAFGELFDGVWSSADLGFKKPMKDFYKALHEMISQVVDVKPSEVAFWDDTQENVDMAADFGYESHLYTSIDEFRRLHRDLFETLD